MMGSSTFNTSNPKISKVKVERLPKTYAEAVSMGLG
jgi:hypothetical protein